MRNRKRQRRTGKKQVTLLSLRSTALAPTPLTIPVRWVNAIIGVFLLPIALVLTQTFFTSFKNAAVVHAFWITEEFWFFSLGAVLWVIAFLGLPRPVLVYVFGHELTHVIWIWLMGGRVTKFYVDRNGGHVVTNKQNFLIALAPYFFPLYSLLVVAIYGVAGLFADVFHYRELLFALIGLTWAFHVSFTLWMIPKGQTDLSSHGTFFSLVVIYLMNLLVIGALLIIASPHVTLRGFAHDFLENAEAFSSWLLSA
ncbi:MAG: hypothetical protein M3O82_01025 [Verrucomicrobiota bacterium]|nr:hypothetical protein [Verrucomicrobiota bacterium]